MARTQGFDSTLGSLEDFAAAVALYTQALMWAEDERLLSNRSAAYVAQGNFKAALEDAKKCAWVEGHIERPLGSFCKVRSWHPVGPRAPSAGASHCAACGATIWPLAPLHRAKTRRGLNGWP